MKRNFFRKVAFGVGPNQEVPTNPIDWSQAQVENVPKISWRKPLPTESELLKLRAQNQKSIVKARKKFRENPQALEAAYSEAYDKADELKIVIYHKSDFRWALKHAAKVNSKCLLYIQPEWSKKEELIGPIVDFVKSNKGWRISLQTHKFMNIP